MTAHTSASDSLHNFMTCERLDVDLYRGQSKDFHTGQVYGGQVLGQAIQAALDTVDSERTIRSAHAYFLLKGDVEAPIFYDVDRSLDGGSVSARRVVARQHGKQILTLSASFQREEPGLEFAISKDIPQAELEQVKNQHKSNFLHAQEQFLDVYYVPEEESTNPKAIQLWIKTKQPLPDDPLVHNSVLAYISDISLLVSTLVPHNLIKKFMQDPRMVVMNSIDHAIWFHRHHPLDNWFLYECEAIVTGRGRGLAKGRIYTPEGELIATSQQEGLLRMRRE